MPKTKKTTPKTESSSKSKTEPKLIGWGIDPAKYAAARKPVKKPVS